MQIKYFMVLMLTSALVIASTIGIAEAIQLQVLVDTGSVYSAYKATDIFGGNNINGSNYDPNANLNNTENLGKIIDDLARLNGTYANQFIKSGLGLTSRIVQIGFSDDQIWYGNADNIKITSLQPYINVDANTKYAAVVPSTSDVTIYNMPNLRNDYIVEGNRLNSNATIIPFTHGNPTKLIGNVSLHPESDGSVTVRGDGIAVLKLGDGYTENVKVSGNGIATHVLYNPTYHSLDLTEDTTSYIIKGHTVVNGVVMAGGDVANSVVTEDVLKTSDLLDTNKSWLNPSTFSDATPSNTTIIKHGFEIGNIPNTNQTTNHVITPIPIGNVGETWGTASITEYGELIYGQHATAPESSIINKGNTLHEHSGYRHSHPSDTEYKSSSGGGVAVDLNVECAETNTCYAHGVAGKYEVVFNSTNLGRLNNITSVSLAGAESWSRVSFIESAEPDIIDLDYNQGVVALGTIRGMASTNDAFHILAGAKVYSINNADGVFDNTNAFRFNDRCSGLTVHHSLFWCFYEFNDDVLIASSDGTAGTTNIPQPIYPHAKITNIDKKSTGMTSHNGQIWAIFDTKRSIFSYNITSNVLTSQFSLDGNNENPVGITYHRDKFWILDSNKTKVYAYDADRKDSDGLRSDTHDFDLAVNNTSPSGIVVHNNMFYVLNSDDNDGIIYIYDGSNIDASNVVQSTVTYNLYNTLPVATLASTQNVGYGGPHDKANDTSFLYIRPVDSTTPLELTLSGAGNSTHTGLSISNLQPKSLYRIVGGDDDYTIDAGIVDSTGTINIANIDPRYEFGKLYLYPNDLLRYEDTFNTAIFDTFNTQAFKLTTNDKKIYTIHAYVKVPISSGPITIGNMTLANSNNSTLSLSYLDKTYWTSDEIHIPVVPGYTEIRMDVDGTPSSLKYANVLGNSGVTIINSATSTIEHSDADTAILNAEAIASSTGYIIATSDGELQAVISETISGSLEITNTYILERDINQTEIIRPRDPLSAYVDVYINGVKDGETIKIGINPFPDFKSIFSPQFLPTGPLIWRVEVGEWVDPGTISNPFSKVINQVTYSYPDYTLSGTISTNVHAGDFVEFHVYAKIYGEIDRYDPLNYTVRESFGESTATANIRSAYVYADYITE